ncbi:MAG: hypothetical protein HY909_28920 [Deltaproteobacteria bacterium]|nr:hypothetical protein [Deltaproteobacteria bacterium]
MRRPLPVLLAMALEALPAASSADPMDLSLNRLSYYNPTRWQGNGVNYDPTRWTFRGGCGTPGTARDPAMDQPYAQCFTDNQLWANLVNELGGALAPSLGAPAMTLGYSGLFVGYDVSVSNINRNAEYWTRGTEGSLSSLVGTGTAAVRDRADANTFVSRLHVRKGLPWGFELGTQVSHLHSSSIWAIGLDLRWSLLEGFRRGIGFLPDFAIRGAVNTMVGQSQMNLTIVGVDLSLSKRFTLGGQVRLTPYLGGQFLMIFGDSGVTDLTPSRSAYRECPRQEIRYVDDTRPMDDPARSPSGRVGQLVCNGGGTAPDAMLPGDLNDTRNSQVFERMRIRRTRAIIGLQLQWELLSFTAEFTTDVGAPGFLSTPNANAGRPSTEAPTMGAANPPTPITLAGFSQWMTTLSAGVSFR